MKIGIAGIGCVGNALLEDLVEKSKINNTQIISYDKFKNIGSFDDLINTEFVFLCLPTLYNQELNAYDKTGIYKTCDKLSEIKYQGLVIIKSTVEPTTCQNLVQQYHLNIVHNPEFLTARTSINDIRNQKHIILGKTQNINEEKFNLLHQFYQNNYPDAEISICSSTESESVKIFCNCFYAVKVQFFNEIYLLCQKLGLDYQTVKKMMIKNNWINPMHTDVPGPDGKLSYGGMCFPKDTNALLSFMKENNTSSAVLEATIQERNLMRTD